MSVYPTGIFTLANLFIEIIPENDYMFDTTPANNKKVNKSCQE